MTSATWVVEIDWNNDGDWSDSGEDVTARVLNNPGLVIERGRDQIRALAPPMAGRCDFALDNASKDYSPDYASGPLYGNLVPGRAIRVRTTAPSAATLWAGHLDDLPQEPWLKGGGRVRAPGLGKLAKLKGVAVSSHYYANIATSAAFGHVCRLAGLAASEYTALDTGQTTLTAWWCNRDDAFGMLLRILAAEGPGAAIYESASGVVTFHSRHYRLLTSRCTTSQATFGNASTEPKHSPPFGYEPGLKGVINSATVAQETRALAGSATQVASWSGSLVIPWGESRDLAFSLSDPATDFAASFTWEPDYAGFTYAFETGGDPMTSASGADVRLQLDADNAEGVSITLRTATITGKVYAATDQGRIASTVDASASRAKYGLRPPPASWSPWPGISEVQAQDLANAVVVAYQEPRATVSVTVKNANSARLAQQLAREVSDRVTVVEGQTGINGPVYIERIRHDVREGGHFHATTFGCELVHAGYDDWFIFDTDNFDDESFGF